ncbi:AAA family ATPase [Sphingomonas sanguinis]|uniref:DNA primase/polymerase bifunctional N-terminal domain-containing protein n=1 Tax=Sphingomonas sanguinis TaxID=33051 RepID=A0A147J2B1_9SPHN|nr:AAA family ATPase [Sphingomonas sanguinis]KTW02418.1 hypothetical protein SB4_03510 [Sphingomonas sanguinis]
MINNNPAMWADHYEAGYSVFPLKPNSKRPDVPSWQAYQVRRSSIEEVGAWVDDDPSRNIGIATGAVSGVVVLDLDSPAAAAAATLKGVPPTVEALTPRGRHLYFRYDPSQPITVAVGGSGNSLPQGIDVRGDGGYVVAPGSYYAPTPDELASGKKEGAYAWAPGHSPGEIDPAPLPSWVVEALAKPDPVVCHSVSPGPLPLTQTGGGTAYGNAALQAECEAIRTAISGTRNHQLNRSTYVVAQLVAGGELDAHDARTALESAAAAAGLERSETRATINSGWASGSMQPRSAPTSGTTSLIGQTTPASESTPPVDPLAGMICAADRCRLTPPPREWLIEDWLPVGAVTTLFGDGGVGKSLVAMQMAAAVASGKDLWGHKTSQSPVIAFYCEDDDNELSRRQQSINARMGLGEADLAALFDQSRFGLQSLLGTVDKRTGAYQPNDLFRAIEAKAHATGARLVILDNINMVYGGEANDPGAVTRFMSLLSSLALSINGAVLLLGHTAKAEGSRFSGTMAWSNASRNRLFFGRPDNMAEAARNPDLRRLGRDKSNYAKAGEELDLMWDRGAFVRPSDLSPSLGVTNDQARDDKAFLDLLDELTGKEQALSINKQARNYAPRIMAKDGRYRNADTERRMTQAMARLLNAGAIVEETALPWQTKRRVDATGIARAPEGTQPQASHKVTALLDMLAAKRAA